MTEQKEIGKMNRLPSLSSGDVTIPLETVLVDRHGVILFTSGDIAAIHAPLALPVAGTPLASILDPLLAADDCRALSTTLASRGPLQFTRNCLTKKKNPAKQLTITGIPFAAADEPQWLLLIQDVSICHAMDKRLAAVESDMDAILLSREKELEEATGSLIETNVALRKEIRDRQNIQRELRRAKELAESANLAKSEFLANMSHELRTPLHAILSFAGYGEKRIEVADRQELLRFFQQIAASGKRLLPLINSLLDLSKLEAGKMEYVFQDLDLLAEIKSVITEIAPLAEKKGLQISIVPPDILTHAFFDQGRIDQVICNILSNGVKFSDPDTTISVAFAQRIDLSNRTLLQTTISNHGVAIPANELTAIFDKFAQSSKTKTGAGGTGLGLAICKQIIEDHRGKIWADSGSDGSTRFHFTLPIKAKN